MLADLIECANAIWAILAFYLAAFMIYHLCVVRVQRRIQWRTFFFNFSLPMSMQLAVGVMVMAVSIFLTRSAIWWARFNRVQDLDIFVQQSAFYFSGIALGVVGFLCILRTVSYPTFGHWPWLGALGTSALYLCWWGTRFLGGV